MWEGIIFSEVFIFPFLIFISTFFIQKDYTYIYLYLLSFIYGLEAVLWFSGVMDSGYYYWCAFINFLVILATLYTPLHRWKSIPIYTLCVLSTMANLHEALSHYQTFLYPYRDIGQSLMVEGIFLLSLIKTKWRNPFAKYS